MSEREALWQRQWRGYSRNHRDRSNLLIHSAAVPAFVWGVGAIAAGLVRGAWPLAAGGAVALVASLAAQGRGHRLEPEPPEPFTGPGQFAARLLTEQFVTFPRFVLSGGWSRAWRESRGSGR